MRSTPVLLLVFLLFSIPVSSQPPAAGTIGLYADITHSINDVWNPGGMYPCTLYVFCLPSENGLHAVEFAVDYPDNVYKGTVTANPLITLSLGDLESGISATFSDCLTDWVWAYQQVLILTDSIPSRVDIVPHSQSGMYQFATCLPGYPTEPAFYSPPLCINASCPPDSLPPGLVTAQHRTVTSVNVYFSERLFVSSAEEKANYQIFRSDDSTVTYSIVHAWYTEELEDTVPGAASMVVVGLGNSLLEGFEYTVRVSGMYDIAGNGIDPGSEAGFLFDTGPPYLLTAFSIDQSTVGVLFNEPLDQSTAGDPANYDISRVSHWADSVTVASAELLGDQTSVRLHLDSLLTEGAWYELCVFNVTDRAGNPLEVPGNCVPFKMADMTPPILTGAAAPNDSSVEVTFNEALDEASAGDAAHYELFVTDDTLTVILVSEAALLGGGSTVRLSLGEKLVHGTQYTLRVSDVMDVSMNPIEPGSEMTFVYVDTEPPDVISAEPISAVLVAVTYSEAIDSVGASDEANYELFETLDSSRVVSIADAELQPDGVTVDIAVVDSLETGTGYTLKVSNVTDLAGNAIEPGSEIQFMIPDIDPPVLIDVTALAVHLVDVTFSEPVDESTAEDQDNYEIFESSDPSNTIGNAGGELQPSGLTVRLTLVTELLYNVQYTVRVSNVEDLHGNAIGPGSEMPFMLVDVEPPVLVEAIAEDYDLVKVTFSERLDAATAEFINHYELFETADPSNVLAIADAVSNSMERVVMVTMDDSLIHGAGYTLRVSNVEDENGNPIVPGSEASFTVPPVFPDPVMGRLGLYIDEYRSGNEVQYVPGLPAVGFTYYLWCRPGENGLMCAEYAIDYPENVIPDIVIYNQLVSIVMGELETGVSVCLLGCMNDWVWIHQQTCYLIDGEESFLGILPHADRSTYLIASCLSGYPTEAALYFSRIHCNRDTEPPEFLGAVSAGDSVVTCIFSEPVRNESAEDIAHYKLFEADDSSAVVAVTGAVLSSNNVVVQIFLESSLLVGESYTVRVHGITDLVGNMIGPGSEATFVHEPSIQPTLVSIDAVWQTSIEVVFSEAVEPSSAEDIANYELQEGYDRSVIVPITGAVLLGDGMTVRLLLGRCLVHDTPYFLVVSNVEDLEGHPVTPGSEIDFVFDDTYRPFLVDMTVKDSTVLEVSFNEPVTAATAEVVDNYELFVRWNSSITVPITAADLIDHVVALTLGEPLQEENYTLRVNNVEDIAGNAVAPGSEIDIVLSLPPSTGEIGLWVDEYHAENEVEADSAFHEFDLYVWCRPSHHGMRCADFAIQDECECPIYFLTSTVNPLVSLSLGDPVSGVNVCFSSCQEDWVWTHRLTCLVTCGDQEGYVRIIPHPSTGYRQFTTCLEGNPVEYVYSISEVLINPVYIATLLESHHTSCDASSITVTWTLSQADEDIAFFIERVCGAGAEFEEITAPRIDREGLTFSFVDHDVESGETYRYRVEYSVGTGRSLLFETEAVRIPSLPLTLYQNRPNPFNPTTTISYYLPSAANVTVDVYDTSGRRICRLVDTFQEKGEHSAEWNGRDDSGSLAASGVYFYRLVAGKETISRKMVLLR